MDNTLEQMMERVMEDMPYLRSIVQDDNSIDPYGIEMTKLHALLHVLQQVKDKGYGSSWARRGESGVFHNLMRKDDRLETLAILNMSDHDAVDKSYRVAFVDVLMDRAAYCLMWVSYIAKVRPADFRAWLEDKWCASTGVPIDQVMEFLEINE